MPRKKRSRVPSRPKPLAPDDSIIEADMGSEQRKEKLRLLLEDFDKEVQRRVEMMEMELQSIQQSVRHLYKTDLMQYSAMTRNMLWIDYVEKNGDKPSVLRKSIADVINNAECVLESAAKKRGRPAKATVARSVKAGRQKTVLMPSQADNLVLPPPSTSRVQRSKKLVEATPAGQNIPQFSSTLLVTPKFDPRNPFPPGTIKTRPRPGDIAMTINGSPLYISPSTSRKPNIKQLMEILNDDKMDETTKQELLEFRQQIDKIYETWKD